MIFYIYAFAQRCFSPCSQLDKADHIDHKRDYAERGAGDKGPAEELGGEQELLQRPIHADFVLRLFRRVNLGRDLVPLLGLVRICISG